VFFRSSSTSIANLGTSRSDFFEQYAEASTFSATITAHQAMQSNFSAEPV
jgi:hypothetical protein